ncbi:MarR family winged helix-turn-helix transcriptional regulator [Streptomyces sp. NPDC004126]|uniref:MarR family winged helix-turn-helix transcriptional regulator n=1 Tax=Streptomyces sp. NPDC004126 TaxID=3390695 RepID=UPI003D02E9BF
MTTTAPALNARVIALAHHAARTLAEGALDRHGVTFHQSVTLRAVTVAGGTVPHDELVAEIQDSLKTTEPLVQAVIEELLTAGLLAREDSLLSLTDTGRDLYETTAAATAGIAARLYAGIPAEDLAVAGRVLTLITDRANAELGTS